MPEEELEKRLRTLEIRGATLLGSITTLAVCCVAFLGFEYYQIPNQVEKQLNDFIDQAKRTKIEKALDNADKLESKILTMEGRKARIIEVKDGDVVHPPNGSEKGDWVALISPIDIGCLENNEQLEKGPSEVNNALISFHLRLADIKDGWKAEVRYRFNYGGNDQDNLRNRTGKAKVLLVPAVDLQPSNKLNSADTKGLAAD